MFHDAIIVLGYNNDPADPIFRARVQKAAELYHDGMTPQLIMSGCCSDKLDIQPAINEAMAMRDAAVELDVPASAILLEEEAVDTLGNFYFSKVNILMPCSWYNVGFVSTPWHVYRASWLASIVLGPDFEVSGYPSGQPTGWDEVKIANSEAYNKQLLGQAQEQLVDIRPGEHEAITPYLGQPPRKRGESPGSGSDASRH